MQINFTHLHSDYPELQDAWDCLERWMNHEPTAPFLDIRRLSQDVPSAPIEQVAFALRILVQRRVMQIEYRVLGSDGLFLNPTFKTTDDIPNFTDENIVPTYVVQ